MMGTGEPNFRVMANVVRLLETNEALSAAVGERIYPLVAPLNTSGDCITYQRDGVELVSSKMQGFAMFKVFFFISIFSDDYSRGLALSDEVYRALVGSHDGFKVEFHDLTESLIDQKFVQILKFSIK